jgi:signal peptidase I
MPSAAAPEDLTAERPRARSALREYAEALAVALVVALFVRCFVVQAFRIPSGSMLPTLQIGDHLLVNKFIYGVRLPILGTLLIPVSTPQRGDVVVFLYPADLSQDFIKRVIGVGGDVVQIRDKRVYINGKLWKDTHAYFAEGIRAVHGNSARDNFGPVRVPRGQLFVMGDNRDRSYDSRFWGFVNLSEVRGKALLIYWSWDAKDHQVRWRRIGEVIH